MKIVLGFVPTQEKLIPNHRLFDQLIKNYCETDDPSG